MAEFFRFAGGMSLRRRAIFGAFALALLALGAAGCSDLLSRPDPEKRLFVLTAERSRTEPAPAGGVVLALRPFSVGPGLDDAGLVTRISGRVVQSDFYHQFFVPPATLIEAATRRWLRASGLFSDVTFPESQLEPSLVLEGALVSVLGSLEREPPVAVLHVQTLLLDVRGPRPEPVAHGDYRVERPLAAIGPDGVVAALDEALAEVLTRLEADLAKRFGRSGRKR